MASWDREYDTTSTAVLYAAADAGNTTAIQTLQARDARASLATTYRLVIRALKRNAPEKPFVDGVARMVGKAVCRMSARDANAGEYARMHVIHAYRTGGLEAVLNTITIYGHRATALAEVPPETVASLARKFSV